MMPFKKCPICGGELIVKEVDKLLCGGEHTATVQVKAEVCLHCGERLYPEEVVRLFQRIRNKLARHDLLDLQPVGQSFKVPVHWADASQQLTS
jgi:YgiT-type zinc finger domain-containing protein